MRTDQSSSRSNTVLNQLREAADILRKPQSVVAANWLRAGITLKRYSAARNTGISRADYEQAQIIVQRLADCAR